MYKPMPLNNFKKMYLCAFKINIAKCVHKYINIGILSHDKSIVADDSTVYHYI